MFGWSSWARISGLGQVGIDIVSIGDARRIGHLDRDRPIEVVVMGKVDVPEPAVSQSSDNPIPPDPGGIADRERTGRILTIGRAALRFRESPVSIHRTEP